MEKIKYKHMKKEIISALIVYAIIAILVRGICLHIAIKKQQNDKQAQPKSTPDMFCFNRLITVTPDGSETITYKRGCLYMKDEHNYILETGTQKQVFLLTSRSARIEHNKWHTLAMIDNRMCSITELYYKNQCIQVSIRTGGFMQIFDQQ
jgi:hypothetical protein